MDEAGWERETVNSGPGFTLVCSPAQYFTIRADASVPAEQTEEEGRRLPLSLSDSCALQRSSISRREMEGWRWRREALNVSTSVLLSGALSGAFFFSLLLSSDSKMI